MTTLIWGIFLIVLNSVAMLTPGVRRDNIATTCSAIGVLCGSLMILIYFASAP